MAFKAFAITFLILATFGCKTESSKEKMEEKSINSPIHGVWKLVDLKIANNGDTTTVVLNETKQYKIYSEHFYMWNRQVPKDSAEWHGFGTYKINGDTIVETPEISSGPMQNFLDVSGMSEFKLDIKLEKDHFRQIIYNPINDIYNIQRYERIE